MNNWYEKMSIDQYLHTNYNQRYLNKKYNLLPIEYNLVGDIGVLKGYNLLGSRHIDYYLHTNNNQNPPNMENKIDYWNKGNNCSLHYTF